MYSKKKVGKNESKKSVKKAAKKSKSKSRKQGLKAGGRRSRSSSYSRSRRRRRSRSGGTGWGSLAAGAAIVGGGALLYSHLQEEENVQKLKDNVRNQMEKFGLKKASPPPAPPPPAPPPPAPPPPAVKSELKLDTTGLIETPMTVVKPSQQPPIPDVSVPEPWKTATSRRTGRIYYVNTVTGESTYDFPSPMDVDPAVGTVEMSPEKLTSLGAALDAAALARKEKEAARKIQKLARRRSRERDLRVGAGNVMESMPPLVEESQPGLIDSTAGTYYLGKDLGTPYPQEPFSVSTKKKRKYIKTLDREDALERAKERHTGMKLQNSKSDREELLTKKRAALRAYGKGKGKGSGKGEVSKEPTPPPTEDENESEGEDIEPSYVYDEYRPNTVESDDESEDEEDKVKPPIDFSKVPPSNLTGSTAGMYSGKEYNVLTHKKKRLKPKHVPFQTNPTDLQRKRQFKVSLNDSKKKREEEIRKRRDRSNPVSSILRTGPYNPYKESSPGDWDDETNAGMEE